MPSQFSGLFYVNEIINRDLHCYFTNENGDALPLTITYFYTRLIADSAPSTAAYIQVHAKKVYWLQGIITFPDQNFQSPMVHISLPSLIKVTSTQCSRTRPFQLKLRHHDWTTKNSFRSHHSIAPHYHCHRSNRLRRPVFRHLYRLGLLHWPHLAKFPCAFPLSTVCLLNRLTL